MIIKSKNLTLVQKNYSIAVNDAKLGILRHSNRSKILFLKMDHPSELKNRKLRVNKAKHLQLQTDFDAIKYQSKYQSIVSNSHIDIEITQSHTSIISAIELN